EAAAARQRADQEATREATLLEQARRQLKEFLKTDGAKVCRLCGQALTPAHWQQEKERRTFAVEAGQRSAQSTAALAKEAVQRERDLREQLVKLDGQLATARESYRTQKLHADQQRRDIERLQRDCGLAYQQLSQPFRAKVAAMPPGDWLTTTYPARADLDGASQQVSLL